MQAGLELRRNELQNNLETIKKEMALYFNCEPNLISFSYPVYFNSKAKIKAKFIFKFNELNNKNWIITEKYFFDFEAEYLKREGLWYYGNFYYLNELSKFFRCISLQIENFS